MFPSNNANCLLMRVEKNTNIDGGYRVFILDCHDYKNAQEVGRLLKYI